MSDGYQVLLVIPKSFIWDYHWDVLRRKAVMSDLPDGSINGCRKASDIKLVCADTHSIVHSSLNSVIGRERSVIGC
jgi:hypothetical protein